jgi:hypothetical protein
MQPPFAASPAAECAPEEIKAAALALSILSPREWRVQRDFTRGTNRKNAKKKKTTAHDMPAAAVA